MKRTIAAAIAALAPLAACAAEDATQTSGSNLTDEGDPAAHVIAVTLVNVSANGGRAPQSVVDRLVEIYAQNGVEIRVQSLEAPTLDAADALPAGPFRMYLTDGTVLGSFDACEGLTRREVATKNAEKEGFYRARDARGVMQYVGTRSRVRWCTNSPDGGAPITGEKRNLLTAWALAHELLHGILTVAEGLRDLGLTQFPAPTYSGSTAEGHLNTVPNLVMDARVAIGSKQWAALERDVRAGTLGPLETIAPRTKANHLDVVAKLVAYRTQ